MTFNAPPAVRTKGPVVPALVAVIIALAVHAAVWFLLRETASPPSATDAVSSLSYSVGAPEDQSRPPDEAFNERAARELATLAGVTDGIRLYASTGRNAAMPALARTHGLHVVAGAWLSGEPAADAEEVKAAIGLARRHANVRAVIVGNETILRRELTPTALIEVIRQVRRQTRQAVSTGETWDIWLAHPELVREVDFIAAHILPYWEGIDANIAVDYAFDRYRALRRAYPGKRVVIAEFGWPSQGYNNRAADTGPAVQAEVVRAFVRRATDQGIEFNIIEAFDQPWKTREGSVGAYWGLFDADGQAKFPLSGEVQEPTFHVRLAVALILGLIASMAGFLLFRSTFSYALVFSLACNALAAPMALAALYPVENYLNPGAAVAWGIGMALMAPLSLLTLVKIHEMADVTLGYPPARLIEGAVAPPPGYVWPKVSVHIPAYRERPEMLIETLESAAKLDYPNFEVLAIVNNTPDEAFWRPIEAACRRLGPRFKFLNLQGISGFKAGALNAAMAQTAPDAEVIALLDADYVVEPTWMKDLVPAFNDPKVALVQAPQDHRDSEDSPLKRMMNNEYTGFFDIGMVQRNEHDAAIAHGTMLLINRRAFNAVGGWATDTLTEDTELGLRLYEAGYSTLYTDKRYGFGLLPDSLQAFLTQRHRWAFGAMQIARKHRRFMLPGTPGLTAGQKAHFLIGWSYWISDAFGVLAAALNLLWVPMILLVGVLIPTLPFTMPILAMFVVNLLHCFVLYLARVRIQPWRIVGAALAAMSVQFTVARAVAEGLWGLKLGFARTDKGGIGRGRPFPAKREAAFGAALALGAALLYATNSTETIEINIFAATLVVQSLPFLATCWMAATERLGPG